VTYLLISTSHVFSRTINFCCNLILISASLVFVCHMYVSMNATAHGVFSAEDSDKTWFPDLPKGSDNYRFGWIRDTPIRLQIQRNVPCNLSTMNPLVINLTAARLTSPRRLTLACESKNTSKCTEKQPNHRKQLIQLTSGVPQPKNGVMFLIEMN
jgi:hypothetical protein